VKRPSLDKVIILPQVYHPLTYTDNTPTLLNQYVVACHNGERAASDLNYKSPVQYKIKQGF
jgi:hypothetical protein